MHYTFTELLSYFFLYSFLGWCLEVAVMSVRRRRFIDPGMLSGPICPSYGITMVLILVFLRSLRGNYLVQFIACMVFANVVEIVSTRIAERTTGRRMWDAEKREMLGSLPGAVYSLVWGLGAMVVLEFLQPLVFILYHMLPDIVMLIVVIVLCVIFALDVFTVVWSLRKDRKGELLTDELTKQLRRSANSFGQKLNARIHIRLQDAYPPVLDIDGTVAKGMVFASGLTLTKMFWVFLICSLLGDIIETFFVRFTAGIWMSRSSVLYGPFSIVWGLGAVVLTVVLSPLAKKGDRYVFLGGFLLGGAYEYACSVFTEIVFGKVFWDYSHMPLNIGGRTNVLFMFFWGVLAVVWVQILYPRLSKLIERIPMLTGTILTWVLTGLMVINALLSGLAIGRYTQRQDGTAQPTAIGSFLDEVYPDGLVEWVWPNMREAEKPNQAE